MTARATRQDWCAAGLGVLRDHGHEAVTIDRLCTTLGKTKGSFYHHFADLDTYLGALLALWEQELTDRPIDLAAREPSVGKRSARLDQVVRGLDHALDLAVRAWSSRDRRARQAIERVDRRRIDYLAELHRASGHKRARLLAELEYAAFVGGQHLGWFDDPRHAATLARAMHDALALLATA